VPHPPPARPDFQEARHRNHRARHILTSVSRGTPALANVWQQIELSLSDVPVLVAEITYLSGEARAERLDRANLAAAGRATLAASLSGEPDPLSYLRDELAAQGFLAEPDAVRDDLMRCRRGRR
jgi:hypothetical protein